MEKKGDFVLNYVNKLSTFVMIDDTVVTVTTSQKNFSHEEKAHLAIETIHRFFDSDALQYQSI